jgi:hypothetical protein
MGMVWCCGLEAHSMTKRARMVRSTHGEFDLKVTLWMLDENDDDITALWDGDNEDCAREWAVEKGFDVVEERSEPIPQYAFDRIEKAAKVLERYLTSPYGWTDEQFEVWWNKDPQFTQRTTCHGSGFIGTHKEYLFKQVAVVLDAAD